MIPRDDVIYHPLSKASEYVPNVMGEGAGAELRWGWVGALAHG